MKLAITALAVAIVSALPGRAEASGIINISQVGADVVETDGAKFNPADFTFALAGLGFAAYRASRKTASAAWHSTRPSKCEAACEA